MGDWGLPIDGFAWFALVGGGIAWVAHARSGWSVRLPDSCATHYRRMLVVLAVLAALLSCAYVVHYLRGGPRIIDATAYFQQARTFAAGHFTTTPLEPSAASRGRFLYFEPLRNQLAVLFPPGYAAVLAIGFRLGAPLLVGPLLAAALVWITAATARRLFGRNDAALMAGILSATSMALRYHTADTMAHGLAALLVAIAIYACLADGVGSGMLGGLSLGWLVATRPVTGAVLIVACLIHRLRSRMGRKWLAACIITMLPGCALWMMYQRASTGSFWHATQLAYYAVADGPPGCFRYGFGKGIGCLFEHGSYIEKRLPNGYGLWQALYVTLLRLRWHCLDIHNFEPLVFALLAAIPGSLKAPGTRLLLLSIVGVIMGYLPFYFDASYPGGGARFFVDIIPLEHALVAGWLVQTRWKRHFVPLSLVGFALHGSFEHQRLRDRDGGRPMFEPGVLAKARIDRGLVFVDTDHGFLLGHDSAARDAQRGVVVLRHRGDANDRIAWESLGRPSAYRYRFDPTQADARAFVGVITPDELLALNRFEAESEWPALAVHRGWVRPVYPPNDCTSARRGLALEPVDGESQATVALYAEHAGIQRIEFGLVAKVSGPLELKIRVGDQTFEQSRPVLAHQCFKLSLDSVAVTRGEHVVIFDAGPTGVILDYWQLD